MRIEHVELGVVLLLLLLLLLVGRSRSVVPVCPTVKANPVHSVGSVPLPLRVVRKDFVSQCNFDEFLLSVILLVLVRMPGRTATSEYITRGHQAISCAPLLRKLVICALDVVLTCPAIEPQDFIVVLLLLPASSAVVLVV